MGLYRGGHQRVHLRFVADIAVHVERAQLGSQCRAFDIVHIGQHDLGTFRAESPGASFAKALRSTGDDDHPVGMSKRHIGNFFKHKRPQVLVNTR